MLNIEHLTKTYGEKKAVDDLSLHIRAGEIFGFIGHNGAGTSTTPSSSSTEAASASTSADVLMMPSPSRSHCTKAPATNALPSSA